MKKMELRPYQSEAIEKTINQANSSADPILIDASVSAGKSFMIIKIMEYYNNLSKNCLCLTMTSDLVKQNATDYKDYIGLCSIFCAKLGTKEWRKRGVFASPQTFYEALKADHPAKNKKFSVLLIDECHNVNYTGKSTVYMKIIEHLKKVNPKMRIIGLTGTPFRGKGQSILGDGEEFLFKHKTANISIDFLIKNRYAVPPVYGTHESIDYDYSHCKIQSNGDYKASELAAASEGKRITADIIKEVVEISKNRGGVLIFASTIKHCEEVLQSLPKGEACLITGKTPDTERIKLIDQIKAGKIKYTVNMNVLTTGFNAPIIDHVVFLRPTSSPVLWVQAIGRGVRLLDGKKDCLVSDYAGNLDRLGEMEEPLIANLKRQQAKDMPLIFECPICNEMNPSTVRRCNGIINGSRCDYLFQFKDCWSCQTQNDITARHCIECGCELIDPNEKLNLKASVRIKDIPEKFKVKQLFYRMHKKQNKTFMRIDYIFIAGNSERHVSEFFIFPPNFHTKSKFLDLHCKFMEQSKIEHLSYILGEGFHLMQSPSHIFVSRPKGDKYLKVDGKQFEDNT